MHLPNSLLIRPALPLDDAAIARLAQLDSQPAPRGQVVIACVDGELAAAVDLDSGQQIADPFRPTAGVLELLHTHARSHAGTA